MDFKREEIENAALVLVVQEDGSYKWSSHRTDAEVANVLGNLANEIRDRHRAQQTT